MSLNDFSAANALEATALFVLPEARSTLSPVSKTEPKRVPTQRLEITRIPQAMRKMGWVTAARMMERWFSTPAWEMPANVKAPGFDERTLHSTHYDDSIIAMAWAQKFQRVQDGISDVGSTAFFTRHGLEELNARLSAWDGRGTYQLGYYGMPVRSFESLCRVNFVKLSSVYSTLDDMYGALGVANLKVGVIGTAVREGTRRVFRASHLGFYILDQYDFNGFQYLGTWTKDRVLTKAEAVFGEAYTGRRVVEHREGAFAKVFNSDFRQYRKNTGRGGDFVVLSDVLWRQCDAIVDLDAKL
jgi:hypothetical protein